MSPSDQPDSCALGGQKASRGVADARTCTGYDRCAAVEASVTRHDPPARPATQSHYSSQIQGPATFLTVVCRQSSANAPSPARRRCGPSARQSTLVTKLAAGITGWGVPSDGVDLDDRAAVGLQRTARIELDERDGAVAPCAGIPFDGPCWDRTSDLGAAGSFASPLQSEASPAPALGGWATVCWQTQAAPRRRGEAKGGRCALPRRPSSARVVLALSSPELPSWPPPRLTAHRFVLGVYPPTGVIRARGMCAASPVRRRRPASPSRRCRPRSPAARSPNRRRTTTGHRPSPVRRRSRTCRSRQPHRRW